MTTTTITTIDLTGVDDNRRRYGVRHESTATYHIDGPIHNRAFSHRVLVWSNADRPNPDGNKTDGKRFIDPSGKPTNDEWTVTLSAQPTVIASHPIGAAVHATEPLAVGQQVLLRFADGTHAFGTIENRVMHDPIITINLTIGTPIGLATRR